MEILIRYLKTFMTAFLIVRSIVSSMYSTILTVKISTSATCSSQNSVIQHWPERKRHQAFTLFHIDGSRVSLSLLFFFFLAALCGMQDLSSPTRD